jgi:hypothetical protein
VHGVGTGRIERVVVSTVVSAGPPVELQALSVKYEVEN